MIAARVAAAVIAAGVLADPKSTLQVIRATPLTETPPVATITVTFDRPVAGSLDRSVDPASVLSITPAIRGRLEWRDPVTIRLRPEAPLPASATYTVTVGTGFTAMDGSRLAEPYQFRFRVTGPKVLAGLPARPGTTPVRYLPANTAFQVVVSSPPDRELLGRLAYIEMGKDCATPGVIRLAVSRESEIPADAPWEFREAGGWDRDKSADALRRVVTLKPVRPLPLGCSGDLVLPATIDPAANKLERWPIATYGTFRLLEARCGYGRENCPTGPITLTLNTPVRGADLLRHLKVLPATKLSVSDTNDIRAEWNVQAELKPRTGYLVELDTTLVDQFGQRLTGNPRLTVTTTSYYPDISYTQGRATIERQGPRTLAVTYVNVDTLDVVTVPIPDSLEARFLARSWYSWGDDWITLQPLATTRRLPVKAPRDRHGVYGVPFPAPDASKGKVPTLFAVKITSAKLPRPKRETGAESQRDFQPIALVQITDLGVHAKIGADEGVVWVTGASDGKPRAGASVMLHDAKGKVIARGATDAQGLARFTGLTPASAAETGEGEGEGEEPGNGFVEVRLGADRALVGINDYDPDLSPWRFNVASAWGAERVPAAGAIFTERGIYRPGDSVFAKAIVRTGLLGALTVPGRSDSIRLTFRDRENGSLKDTTLVSSPFGTASVAVRLPPAAPLGEYAAVLELKRGVEWLELGRAEYRVAEYRPPEFLVDVTADTGARISGDSVTARISARYLFGAPMARASVSWSVRQHAVEPWAIEIPHTEGFYLANQGWWWEENQVHGGTMVSESRTDSLDGSGQLRLRTGLTLAVPSRPARATIEAVVTDVNRQSVFAAASVMLHPASFYVGVKPETASYLWTAGTAQSITVIAVRPDGERVSGVSVRGALVRREWHQVRRETDGYAQLVGEWVSDTVARCAVRTAGQGVPCRFTPPSAGSYVVQFAAADARGREVTSSFYRWVTGPGWVPWSDESQFKMDVIPDRTRYEVGDTATVLFASPFTDADAWITVEREGLIEQRRIRMTSGATTLKFPITEAYAPNVFVSVVVARGRSAKPGPLDDPGRPTIRVGYAELRVTPERKRLTVQVEAGKPEFRPGETASLGVDVRDRSNRGAASEVTLWAVDEGVLSLTGYRTPDPIDLLYRPRGLGFRLGSNLSTVAPQVAAGDKGRNPGGGGGDGAAEILRSRFRTTAFFLGAVTTDAAGHAAVQVTLPDNLTTFRVMAVAVTAGDRFGSGQSPLLVTRPLVARPALPRFVRPGDRLTAGVVVNQRAGGTPNVDVKVTPAGIDLSGAGAKRATLEAGRGREVRFDFTARPGDSAGFRFDVSGAGDRDAVLVKVPIRPAERPRVTTVAGTVRDTATVGFELSSDLDLARSTLSLNLGSSPLGILRGFADDLRVYAYYCTEQVGSVALPLLALYRARRLMGAEAGDTVRSRREIARAVEMIVRRQRDDGAIGYWAADDWSSPWLSAYAGSVLLEARGIGIPVADTVIAGIAGYLTAALQKPPELTLSVALRESEVRAKLAERTAALEFLGAAGRRNRAAENELLRQAAQMAPDDRLTLAIVLARYKEAAAARRLVEPFWRATRVEGRRAVIPDSLQSRFYFASPVRLGARLLMATLQVDSTSALAGPLLETVLERSRAGGWWNTQDYAMGVRAVEAWLRRFPPAAGRTVQIRQGGKTMLAVPSGRLGLDTAVALGALLRRLPAGGKWSLQVAALGTGAPAFYYLTLREMPKTVPVRPESRGLTVERWYEDYATGKPVTEVTEGGLVRVRLKITAPEDRSFLVLDDPLPGGLEAVDLSLSTVGGLPAPVGAMPEPEGENQEESEAPRWSFGRWDGGWWSPFDHRELYDDRVVYAARVLWKGTYSATYVARATTPGTFVRPQTHAEEMYNPAVFGRSDGGVFVVRPKAP